VARVVTIDGPSGSGKGTIARLLAERLGWHCLDSGALYRLVGLAADRAGVSFDDPAALAAVARNLPAVFDGDRVLLAGEDVGTLIRTEQAGGLASRVAAVPLSATPCSTGSAHRPGSRAWSPTGATWGRWSSRPRR
jgi:cytidylate kinase